MSQPKSPNFDRILKYWWAFCVVAGVTMLGAVLDNLLGYRAIGFVFLLAVFAVGFMNTTGPVLMAASLSALAWNYVFIPPRFTFAISAPEDMLLCFGYFVAAAVTGTLTSRARAHEATALEREARTAFLYEVLADILEFSRPKDFLARAAFRIEELFGGPCLIFLSPEPSPESMEGYELIRIRGKEEEGARLYFKGSLNPDQRELLERVAQQLGLAMERQHLEIRLRETEKLEESERLHQTLFNSVSHELRTPLTALMGFASALNDETTCSNPDARKKLTEALMESAARMNRVTGNLLDMSRLSSNALTLHKEWHDVADLIGVVLIHLGRPDQVKTMVPADTPLIEIDFRLMEIALANLVVNALNYSPAGSRVEIAVWFSATELIFKVRDQGRGIPPESLGRLFEKFYRAPGTPPGGTGLGLSIAQSIVQLHRGHLTAANGMSGGAEFTLRLPLGKAPRLPGEESL